jgi:hypothetical protein
MEDSTLEILKTEETRLIRLHRRPRWKRIFLAPFHFRKMALIGADRRSVIHIPRRTRWWIAWQSTKTLCKKDDKRNIRKSN